MAAASDVGCMASAAAVLLITGCVLRVSFSFFRAVLFPSFFPIGFPCRLFLFFCFSCCKKSGVLVCIFLFIARVVNAVQLLLLALLFVLRK